MSQPGKVSSEPRLVNMEAEVSGVSRLRIGIDGEGVTTLVAFMLCPLSCAYCLNPQALSLKSRHKVYTPEGLYDELRKDELYFLATGGGVTFGGGEPLLRHGFIRRFREICGKDWKINLETSLNVPEEYLEDVIPVTDSYIVDVKDMNPEIYSSYTGKDNSKVLRNLSILAERGLAGKCVIRVPEIQGHNTPEDVRRSVEMVQRLGFENIDLFKYDIDYGKRKRDLQSS